MLSPNPHYSYFRVSFPNEFFLESITKKYDSIFTQYKYPFQDMKTVFLESFQGIEFPGFGYQTVSQNVTDANQAGYDWNQPPKSSEQLLAEQKILTLTFRHIDAFLTYFFAMETFFKRYELGPNNETKRKPFGPIILDTLDTMSEQPVCRLKFFKCHLIGLTPIEFTYSDPKRSMDTYELNFSYTEFETSIIIPELKLKK